MCLVILHLSLPARVSCYQKGIPLIDQQKKQNVIKATPQAFFKIIGTSQKPKKKRKLSVRTKNVSLELRSCSGKKQNVFKPIREGFSEN